MRFARGLLIFSCGLFTIGAQTLLFREFVTAFEGNDISVGVFFGAWFLWVGLGAVFVRRWSRLADLLVRHVESVLLLYLPAFVTQLLLIVQVRELAGIASYDLMSLPTIVFWAMIVNAPVSFVTGVVFPVACRWIERTDSFPISRVYLLEAMGSFAGGLAVTALLACHWHMVRVSFLLALAPLSSIAVAGLRRKRGHSAFPSSGEGKAECPPFRLSLIFAVLSALGIVTGIDGLVARHLRVLKWSKLLPREAFQGAFSTAQAEYLYGHYRGQWVVLREGSVCEALPNEEEAGQIAALALCQNPQARRALVIGSGLALCRRLLMLPQMEEVAWANADREYAHWLLRQVPGEFWTGDQRFHAVPSEIRQYFDATPDRFDLIVVNLPEVTSATFNRYYTVEFYERVQRSLRDGGILSVSIAGTENVMGAELVGLGASANKTLEQVFAHLVLVPGEQTWLIASDAEHLTGDPALLRDRFAAIQGSQDVYPPAGLLSVYQPQVAARVLQSYEKANLPKELLINRDARPLTHLYGLLLAARQSGASLTRLVRLLAVSGWLPFAVPILIFVALRGWSLATQKRGARESSFDSSFLIFSTGWVGIATIIILMYAYETHFGSLYLHVGVISSLFMAGLTAGALVCSVLVRAYRGTGIPSLRSEPALSLPKGQALPVDLHGRDAHATELCRMGFSPCGEFGEGRTTAAWAKAHPTSVPIVLLFLLLAHALLLAAVAFWFGPTGPARWSGHGVFALAFILSGLCCGGYWPVAAAQLAGGRLHAGEAGSRLQTADHLGACLGGLATSLLAVPVLGTRTALLVLAGLLLANLPAAVFALCRRESAGFAEASPKLRQTGYALFAVVSCIVLGSNVLAHAGARLEPTLPESAVRALAPDQQTQPISATPRASGRRTTYLLVTDIEQKPVGYLFSSADFAPEIRGFGGKLNLVLHVDTSGKLIDFLLVRSNETPSYLDLLRGWLASLKGKALFNPEPFADVQAVTGATISSQAILDALRVSGPRFAKQALGKPPAVPSDRPAPSWMEYVPDTTGLYLAGAFVAAFLVAHWGGFRSRIALLTLTLAIGGILLNTQYSSEQIATLLSLETPTAGLTGVFLLVVGVPLAGLLFGNLYCGYVCPFGAAQELLSYLMPRRFRPAAEADEMRRARFIKYVVLAVLVVIFFVARDRHTLAGDPLTSIFGLRSVRSGRPAWMFGVVGIALLGSVFYVRFWCRYLCPAGAFLSLLNHVRLLGRYLPAKRFGHCEFGLAANDHLDCLYCDRCRHVRVKDVPTRAGTQAKARPLVLAAAVGALLVVSEPLSQLRRIMPLLLEEPASPTATAGRPREVDERQIRTLIEQRRLSDRKAEYYKQVQ
jgi:spermidine synthase/Na+-translocating ferredoxin:NAD+ oxidoreductase RnfG subunit